MKISTSTQLAEATKQESTFIELEEGRNVVRLVSEFHGVKEHKLNVNGKYRFVACPKAMEEWRAMEEGVNIDKEVTCPVCEKGKGDEKKTRTSFLATAINRKNGKVGILKKGTTIFSPLIALKEEGFDLMKRDIVISRKGKDLETEYTVSPTPNDSDLTEDEQQAVLNSDINLEQSTTPRPYSEIADIMAGKEVKFEKK